MSLDFLFGDLTSEENAEEQQSKQPQPSKSLFRSEEEEPPIKVEPGLVEKKRPTTDQTNKKKRKIEDEVTASPKKQKTKPEETKAVAEFEELPKQPSKEEKAPKEEKDGEEKPKTKKKKTEAPKKSKSSKKSAAPAEEGKSKSSNINPEKKSLKAFQDLRTTAGPYYRGVLGAVAKHVAQQTKLDALNKKTGNLGRLDEVVLNLNEGWSKVERFTDVRTMYEDRVRQVLEPKYGGDKQRLDDMAKICGEILTNFLPVFYALCDPEAGKSMIDILDKIETIKATKP